MFGKPVICSNVGGPAERIENEVAGLHFAMGDHRALAAVLRRASTLDEVWSKLFQNVPTAPPRALMAGMFSALYSRASR